MRSKQLIIVLGLLTLALPIAMAIGASTAEAKYVLLLNESSVESLTLSLEGLPGYLTAENGLKTECESATGTAKVETAEGDKKVVGSTSLTFEGCVWVGSESTCTINDEGEGLINLSSSGELVMPHENAYAFTAASAEFTTIFTEGIFCTIPEEEVLSGTISASLLDASSDAKVKSAHLKADNVKLGNSYLAELVGEMHIRDAKDPNATLGIHLVGLEEKEEEPDCLD